MSKVIEFYAGRTVMITGVTGFMGKVLLERMLCTLPDIKCIYVLLRPKKGSAPQERLKKLISEKPFTFNNISRSQFEKVSAISGDMGNIGLDLSPEDREKIINEVSIVVHLAAATRFDLPLKDALVQNTISTKMLLELCMEIKNLVSIVHVSTAYCNVDIGKCEEKVYDIDGNIDEILKLVNYCDPNMSEQEIIAPHPNTYTYTKRLAEIIARDMGKHLPVSIVRPSIVIPAWKKPIEGWVDNLYGPIGLLSATGIGIVRIGLLGEDIEPDLIPVDCAINGIIAASWFREKQKNDETPVLNLTLMQEQKRSWKYITDSLRTLGQTYPFKQVLWYPRGLLTTNYILYYLVTFICQVLPSMLLDAVLILCLQKPFMVNMQKKIFNGMKLVSYFGLRKFSFITTKAEFVFRTLPPIDQEIFYTITDKRVKVDEEYIKNSYFGVQKYVFKDDGSSTFRYYQIKILYLLDILLKLFVFYGLLWFVFYILKIFM